ncbi:MAG: hypothetical protein ACTS3F_14815 [Phycisphaerales bacterium]
MSNPTTGQPVIPTTGPTLRATGEVVPRAVDLGREDHLVTWGEWFGRSQAAMSSVLPEEFRDKLLFRATLVDGRQFLVREVRSHVSRGRCTIEKTRWHDRDAICDVITGYLFIGHDGMGLPTTVSVLPTDIATVECVLAAVPRPAGPNAEPANDLDETMPFGFAAFEQRLRELPTRVEEVEEHTGASNHSDEEREGGKPGVTTPSPPTKPAG